MRLPQPPSPLLPPPNPPASPPHLPGPPLPPYPPLSPGQARSAYAARLAFIAAGSVQDFDARREAQIQQRLASSLGVRPSRISIRTRPGSVVVEVTIDAASVTDAGSLVAVLDASFRTPEAVSAQLGEQVTEWPTAWAEHRVSASSAASNDVQVHASFRLGGSNASSMDTAAFHSALHAQFPRASQLSVNAPAGRHVANVTLMMPHLVDALLAVAKLRTTPASAIGGSWFGWTNASEAVVAVEGILALAVDVSSAPLVLRPSPRPPPVTPPPPLPSLVPPREPSFDVAAASATEAADAGSLDGWLVVTIALLCPSMLMLCYCLVGRRARWRSIRRPPSTHEPNAEPQDNVALDAVQPRRIDESIGASSSTECDGASCDAIGPAADANVHTAAAQSDATDAACTVPVQSKEARAGTCSAASDTEFHRRTRVVALESRRSTAQGRVYAVQSARSLAASVSKRNLPRACSQPRVQVTPSLSTRAHTSVGARVHENAPITAASAAKDASACRRADHSIVDAAGARRLIASSTLSVLPCARELGQASGGPSMRGQPRVAPHSSASLAQRSTRHSTIAEALETARNARRAHAESQTVRPKLAKSRIVPDSVTGGDQSAMRTPSPVPMTTQSRDSLPVLLRLPPGLSPQTGSPQTDSP
jgi:hypothetical protein